VERGSGTVVVDHQVDAPEAQLAIVEHVVGIDRALVDQLRVGQVGEAPSGVGAKPPIDVRLHEGLVERLTLSPKLARLMSLESAVHEGESPPVDSLMRLAESDELAYVHVERQVFASGYEKGGAMQYAAGGYMYPEVRALRRNQRRSAMRMQLELASVRDAAAQASARILPRVGSCVRWSLDAPAAAAPRVTRAGPLASALRASVLASSEPAAAECAACSSARSSLRVLVMFSGRRRPKSLRRALEQLGVTVVTFEILDDPIGQDLTRVAVQRELLGRVAGGEFDAVFMAPPCASFCLALQPVLRSKREPLGISPVLPEWAAYLRKHNALVQLTADVCLAAESAGVAWFVENPASRESGVARWDAMAGRCLMWHTPAMVTLAEGTGAREITFAQCRFDSPYQKYTTLLVAEAAVPLARRALAHAVCTCTSHAKVAKGRDEFGDSLSAPAAEYPPALCNALAKLLLDAATLYRAAREPEVVPCGLAMGSADPHELRLNDDRVPRSRRKPTFSLQAHAEAAACELVERPVVALNRAESTAVPPDAPLIEMPAPPLVMHIGELLKPVWCQRLNTWMRRLRRCMRLVAAGNWRAGRRMRPPDLWVSAADSMLPSTAAWDWDLTPWRKGEAAVPCARSIYPGAPPQASINFDEVLAAHAAADGAFVDHAIVREMVDGIADDVTAQRGSFLCAPHAGGMQFFAEANTRLQAGVRAGWASEHDEMPFWPLRCDPYSIVDESERAGKPKFRLTNDHSWPPPLSVSVDGTLRSEGGEFVQSLNESMDRSTWPAAKLMRVQQMAEAAAILQASGARVRLGVLDIVAYYKQFGRQLDELYRNGAFTEKGFVVDERCCFGSAADAAKCSRISNFLVFHARRAMQAIDERYPSRDEGVLKWLKARRVAGAAAGASESDLTELWACLHVVGMYIDDGSHASIDDALYEADGSPVLKHGVHLHRAQAHFEAFQAEMARFGLETAKEQPPCECVTLLGVDIDLTVNRLRLTDRKRHAYATQAEAMAQRPSCSPDELVSLLGKLGFAALCYPRGRQWLHAPWRALRARYRTSDGVVLLSKATRESLLRWVQELRDDAHEGVPLAARSAFPAASDEAALVIYADAAGDSDGAGYCAWTVIDCSELLLVEGRWSTCEREHLLICDLELAASTFGLVALQGAVGREFVYSFTDNTVAMAAMRNLTPTTACMQALTAERSAWLLERGVVEACERITSKANLWADMGSRARVGELMAQAGRLGLSVRRVETPPEWRAAVAREAEAAAALAAVYAELPLQPSC
jgi:hypothetical protein